MRAAKIFQSLDKSAAKPASERPRAFYGLLLIHLKSILDAFEHQRAQFLPDVAVVVLSLPDVLQGPLSLLVHLGDAEIVWHFSQEFPQVKGTSW